MFYYLIMYCLSFLIIVTTISCDCRAEDFIIAIDIGHTIKYSWSHQRQRCT